MAARYKSAFASASGFCSANAAQRASAAPAVSSKKPGLPEAAKAMAVGKSLLRGSARGAKRAA